jgi:hypothetical protein
MKGQTVKQAQASALEESRMVIRGLRKTLVLVSPEVLYFWSVASI